MQDQRSTGRPPYNPQLWRGKNCDRVYRRARRESARRVYLQTTNSGSGGGVVTQARDGSAAAGAMVVKLPGNEISGSVITGNYHYGNYAQNYRNNHSP